MRSATTAAQPLISVVIPTYNGGAWLLDTIASCINQHPVAPEVIVVDDASSDDSPDRVAATYPQVRLIRQASNSGCGAHGRNIGLQLAQGRYVKFLDHDDLLEPGTLATEVAAAEAQQADMVMSNWGDVQTAADGSFLEPSRRYFFPPEPEQVIEAILREERMPYTAGVLYRRSYIQEQRWDARLTINDDFDWFCRNAVRGGRIIRLNHVSYYWRLHANSLQGRQGRNPLGFVEAVLIRNHVYAHLMDVLSGRGAITPERSELLADRFYSQLRVLCRYDRARCQNTIQRIQTLNPNYRPSPGLEPSNLIRRLIRWLGLQDWIRLYGNAARLRDRLRPRPGRLQFFTTNASEPGSPARMP